MSGPGAVQEMGDVLLDVRGLRVSFGGHEVVHGIDFSVHKGEKLALVGESGSGKTVTALSLLRLLQEAEIEGQVLFDGRDLLGLDQRALRAVRGDQIACIFQEPMTALNPLFTVGDQISEILTLKKGLDPRRAFDRAVELLATTGIPEPERRSRAYPHQLSGGQRQRAMIAMALACEPRLLLADEPTTALDASLRVQMLELLGDMQRRFGLSVLLITHDLRLVRGFADRIAVMEQGHLVEQGGVAQVFAAPAHPYTHKLLNSLPQRDPDLDDPHESENQQGRETVLRTERLRVSYPIPLPGFKGWFRQGRFEAVKGVDLVLQTGRTLGVVGESGSGKSTLALAALGLIPSEGELRVMGLSWPEASGSPLQIRQLRQQVQVVFQDPFSSLSPRLTIEQIVGEGLQVHCPGLSPEQRRERVVAALQEVGLLPEGAAEQGRSWLQRYPHEFSGGQRQRIAVARALIVDPKVLVLDEPTSALDVTVQKQVIELLRSLQKKRGLSYLLITHDVDVIRALAHEVMVMRDGAVVEAGPARQVLEVPRHPYTQTLLSHMSEL